MTDPPNADARLSRKEVDMIDSYFSRNYRRGERLEVPKECYEEGIKWKDRRLRELGFYDRIYHRKILKLPQNNSGTKPEYQFWLRYWIHLSLNQFDNGQMPH